MHHITCFKNMNRVFHMAENGTASTKRMDTVRKGMDRTRKIGKHLLFWQLFRRGLVGYGERPLRIVAWSLFLILFGAFWYQFAGIGFAEPGMAPDFWQCLYLSFVTFTTLGYGDVRPIAWSKPFAMFQAFSGMFMMALFAIVFGRKVMRG